MSGDISRSEAEILGRSGIPIPMGEALYRLRPLSMDQADRWQEQITAAIASNFAALGTFSGIDAIKGLVQVSLDAGLDLLYAYDNLGTKDDGLPTVLPGRSVLRAGASRADVFGALRKLVEHEFPPLKSAEFLGTFLPSSLRTIFGARLLEILTADAPVPPSAPSSSDSFTSIPDIATRKRSARH